MSSDSDFTGHKRIAPLRSSSNGYFFLFSFSGLNMNYLRDITPSYLLLIRRNELTLHRVRAVLH